MGVESSEHPPSLDRIHTRGEGRQSIDIKERDCAWPPMRTLEREHTLGELLLEFDALATRKDFAEAYGAFHRQQELSKHYCMICYRSVKARVPLHARELSTRWIAGGSTAVEPLHSERHRTYSRGSRGTVEGRPEWRE